MTDLVPVRDIGQLRFVRPADERWILGLTWVPVSATEIHLASRYYPLAVRFDGHMPRLGLIVDQCYLTYEVVDANGAWRGAYRPIALRCFPFEAPTLSDDPLADIRIDICSRHLSTSDGAALVDDAGRPSPLLTGLHRLFGLLKSSEESFAGVLDQFLMTGLLAPLGGDDAEAPPLYVFDPAKISQLTPKALGAMARRNFHGIDIALSGLFSLQRLRPERRPKAAERSDHPSAAVASIVPDIGTFDDLALDDGELIPLAEIGALVAGVVAAS
jgi:hypothetical protein